MGSLSSGLETLEPRVTHLIPEESTFPIALLLGLEPVGVALGPGVDEGCTLALLGVVVPIWNSLFAGSLKPRYVKSSVSFLNLLVRGRP